MTAPNLVLLLLLRSYQQTVILPAGCSNNDEIRLHGLDLEPLILSPYSAVRLD